MKESKFKNISELLGKGIDVSKSLKSTKKEEEKFFMELLENLCQIEAAGVILDTVGIHVSKYNNPYIHSIRMLMERYFGETKTEVVLWWVFESITPNGDVYPLLDENNKRHVIRTPQQLYKFLKRYDGK